MIPGRSKAAFKAWLTQRPQAWREAVEVVAMDGFTGFKTAAAEEIPAAVAVMDPFHVVRLAATSPTTLPDPYSRQADSDPTTPCIGEEPLFLGVGQDTTETGNQ